MKPPVTVPAISMSNTKGGQHRLRITIARKKSISKALHTSHFSTLSLKMLKANNNHESEQSGVRKEHLLTMIRPTSDFMIN